MQSPPFVVIESPWRADPGTAAALDNARFAKACLADSLQRGEAPFASHLLYTLVLDDATPEQREQGIEAGLAIGRRAVKTIVYVDRGISSGMQRGIDRANAEGRPVIYRRLYTHANAEGARCGVFSFKGCDCGATE